MQPNQTIITVGNTYTAADTNLYIGWNSPAASFKTLKIPTSTGSLTTIVTQDIYGNASLYPITVSPLTGSVIGSSSISSNNGSLTLLDTVDGWASIVVPSASPSLPGGSNGDIQYNNSGTFGGTNNATLDANGNINANSFITSGATSSQFVKGDGSLDNNTYLTSSTGVTTFSAGTTGFSPSSASSGAITLSGTLSISNGGTNNTSYTTNSIPYFDGTKLTEDNSNFSWDDGTKILNLGTGISYPANNVSIKVATPISGAGVTYALTGSSAPAVTSGVLGNIGGPINYTAGTGGDNSSTNPSASGAAGGTINLKGGVGGNYTGSGTNFQAPGGGGPVNITGGTGGTNSRTNGGCAVGGSVTFQGGLGGSTTVLTQFAGGGGSGSVNGGAGGTGPLGGQGGSFIGGGGPGGNATLTNASTANAGGAGGSVLFSAGVGGNAANSTTSNTAGTGGDLSISAGRAGTAVGTGAVGSRGGNITFQGGAGTSSAGITANGGNLYYIGGASGPAGGQVGFIALNANASATRGGTVVGGFTTPNAQIDIRPITAGTIGQIVQGFASQTADLTQWQNSSAGVLASINSSGILNLGLAGIQTGTIKFNGTTSGTVTFNTAAAAGTWTMTLPTNAGSGGQSLITDGSGITSWSNILSTVTTVSLTNQNADIASTNFSGANIAGLYRVHYSLEDTTADITAGAVTLTISYTADSGATSILSAAQVLTGTGLTQGTIFVQLASGNISYSTSHTGLFGTAQYALYMTVERLK